MGKKLATSVHVLTDDGPVVYQAGDEPSAEHRRLITNPSAWAEDDSDEDETPVVGAEVPGEDTVPMPLDAPPSKRAGDAKWRDYAEQRGVEVPDDASKEQIMSTLQERGVPTE